MKKYIFPFLFIFSISVWGQEITKPQFTPPFDFPIFFAGNFGELRTNHFHGGLDFKTQGVIGKKVRALADGYISRIRVTHGSGYMLYVTYNNGYTTINRHLSAFLGDIAKRVEDLQYENESWEIDICPEPGEYPVKQGEVMAISGNTGYSMGPHLHLDMIENETGDYVDPLPFFADKIVDRVPPRALGIMLFPQPEKGLVNGSSSIQRFPLKADHPITAWGEIGIGIRAYDYMDGVYNRYGVKDVLLEVNGKPVFRSLVDHFSDDEHRYINSWAYHSYMKSFADPGNHLRLLHPMNGNRGIITIDEERPYHFVYTLKDALGNTSHVRFTIWGKRRDIPKKKHREKYFFQWDRTNFLQEPGLNLIIPRGCMYKDEWLNYEVREDTTAVSFVYQINDEHIPLHRTCQMRIALRKDTLLNVSKYYVAGVGKNGKKYYVGGKYKEGIMEVGIREMATFMVAIDTVPPVLTPVNQNKWGRNRRIVFTAKDKESGIASYRGTIDGKYALFGKPNAVNGSLVCELDAGHVKKGKKHLLEMSVTDACGNQTTKQYHFVW